MNRLEAAMKLANVVTRKRDGVYVAYYNGDDAPFIDGVGYTKECAIQDLYSMQNTWKKRTSVRIFSRCCSVLSANVKSRFGNPNCTYSRRISCLQPTSCTLTEPTPALTTSK